MVGWDEILAPEIPKTIMIQSWRGTKSLAEAARQGYPGILSAGYYLDLMQSAAQHYAVDPLQGEAASLAPEEQARILGGEAAMWEELVTAETLDAKLWPRLAAIAERLWSPQSTTDVGSMYARLDSTDRWLEWLGLTQRSNLELMRERLAGGMPVGPLDAFAAILEPVKGYERHRAPYGASTPFNHLVDAIPPESRGGSSVWRSRRWLCCVTRRRRRHRFAHDADGVVADCRGSSSPIAEQCPAGGGCTDGRRYGDAVPDRPGSAELCELACAQRLETAGDGRHQGRVQTQRGPADSFCSGGSEAGRRHPLKRPVKRVLKTRRSCPIIFFGACQSMRCLTPQLLLFSAAALVCGQQSVTFKDPVLDQAVHKYLPDQDTSHPSATDGLAGVILVSAEAGQTIHDLSGLEACTKLTFLYLPDAPVTDLSPLAKLTNLESVTIRGGKIHDLTPLAGLAKLQFLDLAGNEVSDLRPLASLKALTHLDLSSNKVSDLSPLSGLPNLQELIVAGNQVADLGPLAGIKSLLLLDVKEEHDRGFVAVEGSQGLALPVSGSKPDQGSVAAGVGDYAGAGAGCRDCSVPDAVDIRESAERGCEVEGAAAVAEAGAEPDGELARRALR